VAHPELDALPPLVPTSPSGGELEDATARLYESSLRDRVASASEPNASLMPPVTAPGT
jgi:hypothetical protein